MRLAPALALALAPFAARALTANVNGSTADVLVGSGNCRTLQLTLNWNLEVPPSGEVRAMGVHNQASCTSRPASPQPEISLREAGAPTSQTESATTSASALAIGNTDGGTPGCDNPDLLARRSANPITNYLCVQFFDGFTLLSKTINVRYALAKPLPPTGVVVTPKNKQLRVDWSKGDAADTIASYDVHAIRVGGSADGGVSQNVTTLNADVTRTDDNVPLVNGTDYSITVVARDTYGNVSDPSAQVVQSPVASSDFYDHYRNEGGSAEGGCATGGASAWIAAIAIATALLLRRRRKVRNGAALVALLSVLAPAAQAQDRPRRFLLGFKMDRYDPKVDSEPGLTGTPYHDVFGPRAPPRFQLEFDWEVAHPLGSFLVGATVGFWQNYGKALLLTSTPGNPVRSQDTTLLNVIPFGLIATYRFDWLADRWARFPFIPYAQAGLMRALWISYDGTGDVSRSSGQRGSGWTNGYTTALGFAINLNAIDLDLAREAYLDTGIQRTTLFAEYGWTYLSNFNKRGALILTDRAWRFGLAVEF